MNQSPRARNRLAIIMCIVREWEKLTIAVSNVSFGTMSLMHPVVHSHMIVITGMSRSAISLQRCQGYFMGSW
jgi:hypothetical protein